LIDIAQLPSEATASTAEIAERQALVDEMLDKVLIRLRNSGILSSTSKQTETFTLSRPASEIKLGE
jgi:DNA-binding IscR family transcriptional regulator